MHSSCTPTLIISSKIEARQETPKILKTCIMDEEVMSCVEHTKHETGNSLWFCAAAAQRVFVTDVRPTDHCRGREAARLFSPSALITKPAAATNNGPSFDLSAGLPTPPIPSPSLGWMDDQASAHAAAASVLRPSLPPFVVVCHFAWPREGRLR